MLVDEGVRELDRTFDRDRDRNSRRAGDGDRTRVREKDNGSRQQLPVRNVTRASPSQSTSTTSSLPPARRRGTARQDYSSESTGRAEGDEYQHASEGHGSYRSQRRDSVRTRSYDSDVVRRTPPDARRTLSGQLEQLKGRVKHSSASTHKTRPRQAAAAVYSGGEYDDNRTHPRPGHARDRRVVVTAAGHAEDAPRDALDAADDESATDTSSRRARHQASRCNRLSIETATTLTPTPTPQPPTPQWPPAPLRKAGRKWLTGKEAYHFICAGAAQFDGSTEALAHAPDGQARFFASPCQYSREPIPKAADDEIGQGADPKDGLTDAAPWQASAFAAASMPRSGFDQDRDWPWLALEQPSMETCFGVNPGTTTLNYFVGKAGCLTPPLRYAGDVKPRPVTMMEVFERIRALKNGLESDDPELLYHGLYSKFLDDPHASTSPHVAMELQISDLITVLSHPDWVDFSQARNQVVAKFFEKADARRLKHFYHQLLLALELHLRIHSTEHLETAKDRLLAQLPPKIAWDLALAQRWQTNMSITKCVTRSPAESSIFSYKLRRKSIQVEALRRFATVLKWPNLAAVTRALDERRGLSSRRPSVSKTTTPPTSSSPSTSPADSPSPAFSPSSNALHSGTLATPIEDRSAESMSWFSGVILPGPTLPWLVMNALIDCDDDATGPLRFLTHMHPASGFQYLSNTYWSNTCIVGKVLGAARGVKQIAGWVGPCHSSTSLRRSECVRVRQLLPSVSEMSNLGREDLEDMECRTRPLGPWQENAERPQEFDGTRPDTDKGFPVADYHIPVPDLDSVTDAIRLEKLSFVLVSDGKNETLNNPDKDSQQTSNRKYRDGAGRSSPHGRRPQASTTEKRGTSHSKGGTSSKDALVGPSTFDSSITFAIGGDSCPVMLRYDVDFVFAYPCRDGPHPLHYKYPYQKTAVDQGLIRMSGRSGLSTLTDIDRHHTGDNSLTSAYGRLDSRALQNGVQQSLKSAPTSPSDILCTPDSLIQLGQVLVIEALGVSDNEIFARAWCSSWGISAILSNVKHTCLACSIREAYAVGLRAIIVTEGGRKDEADEE